MVVQYGEGILSYLWGIETVPAMTKWRCKMRILSYLWGIETFYSIIFTSLVFCDFILPMRNWNKKNLCTREIGNEDFILPMRNWNIGMSYTWMLGIWILSYLWGIETTKLENTVKKIMMILSYLWGIETI